MKMLLKTMSCLAVVLAVTGYAHALQILVIADQFDFDPVNSPRTAEAVSTLNALGHTVTTGNDTLADFSPFDQVWDLRDDRLYSGADDTAFGNYLAGGGRVYHLGEHPLGFAVPNASLVNHINNIGGGALTLLIDHQPDLFFDGNQGFTPEGAIVNSPNNLVLLNFAAAELVSNPGSGFLVTETAANSGLGTVVAWDFGQIAGAPNARMLTAFDINITDPNDGFSGAGWVENAVTYLGANPDAGDGIPEPLTAALGLMGLGALGLATRRRVV